MRGGPGLPPFLRVSTDAVRRADSRPPGPPQHPAWHGPGERVCADQDDRAQLLEAHADVSRLIELGLIERTDDDMVTFPFDAIEIRMALARAA